MAGNSLCLFSIVLKIGIIGLDTSHMVRFAELLNASASTSSARIIYAVPGGSPGLNLSVDRLDAFVRRVHDDCGVSLVRSIESLPESLDAIMIGSVDPRQHLSQFRKVAPRGIPIFINKPLVLTLSEARALDELSRQWDSPFFSCSGMRFAEALTNACATLAHEEVVGADIYCPMELVPEIPGYFWYGIHAVEMAYRIMGSGCRRVCAQVGKRTDTLTAHWSGGRIVTLRGQRSGNKGYGGTIHLKDRSLHFQVGEGDTPFYVCQLEAILEFFRTRVSPVPQGQTLEIIRFMEAANQSRECGFNIEL